MFADSKFGNIKVFTFLPANLEKGNLLCRVVMGGAMAGGSPKNSNGLPTALSRNDAVEIYPW